MVLGSDQTRNHHRRAVGTFPNRQMAEQALHELRDSGFPMDRVSVIAKDADRNDEIAGADVKGRDAAGNKADEGATVGAVSGGALGGITGLLVGLGTLAIPGIGPIMLAGAGATALATTLAGGAIGAAAGGLLGALVGLGIPEDRARVYNERVSRGEYLVLVDGTDTDIARAESILRHRGIEEYGVYDIPAHSASAGAATGVATGAATTSGVTPTTAATPTTATPIPPATTTATTATTTPSRMVNARRRAVGAFENRRDAERALTELRDSGFSMDRVSIIGKDSDGNMAGVDVNTERGSKTGNKADEGAKAGAATGAAVGGLGGLLVGLGALAIPGIGPVMLGGAAATALATALSGGAIGAAAGGLTGGLVGLGIPEDRAKVYNDHVNRGHYLVMVDGSEDELRRAQSILNRHNIRDWDIYDATEVDAQGSVAQPHHRTTTDAISPTDRMINERTSDRVVDQDPDVIIVDRRDEPR
nr:MAG: histidine kinase [Leptolyngbya sp. IPPAS B-1204]